MPVSVLKRISKKESSRFFFFLFCFFFLFFFFVFCRLKKNGRKQTLSPPHPTQTNPSRGKKSSGQERTKERSKEKWWKRAEIPRGERQRLEGGCVTEISSEQFFYIYWQLELFYFYYIFCCLISVDFLLSSFFFFILYLVFC